MVPFFLVYTLNPVLSKLVYASGPILCFDLVTQFTLPEKGPKGFAKYDTGNLFVPHN